MNRDEGKIGMKVYFGRQNGQQTLGEIVKINPKKFKVKQLEARGVRKSHAVGAVWTVPPSLCTPVYDDDEQRNAARNWVMNKRAEDQAAEDQAAEDQAAEVPDLFAVEKKNEHEDMFSKLLSLSSTHDWRAPINAHIKQSDYDAMNDAVIFYTATCLDIVDRDDDVGTYRVHAIGYRMGPAGP